MKCNVCDAPLSEPKFNPEVRGSFDPCDTCMQVVEDTLAGFVDRPSASEDELGQFYLPLKELFGGSFRTL